jgi:hypothetical protein
LRVQFFGDENSPLASNSVWTLTNLTVPAPMTSAPLNYSKTLQGVSLRIIAIGGAGNFTYSNGIALKAAPLKPSQVSDVVTPGAWSGANTGTQPAFNVTSLELHLAMAVNGIAPDRRLTVRAVDDQGRVFYARTFTQSIADLPPGPNYLTDLMDQFSGAFVFLDLPADAKTVSLTFCVHACRTAEFVFKPPQPGASARK